MYKVKCPVCGRYELETFDECPYCHWELDGLEDELPEDVASGGPMGDMSVADAKYLLSQGKDVFGDPLPEK
ncbi:MAG: hypothetical protein HFE28_01360 [Clostridia bacterium]|jgi:hypothetical protein|nr:hypothetical protein [Clostridia bacterium]